MPNQVKSSLQDPNFMANLDIDSFFTNVLPEENIYISIDILYKNNENLHKIPKDIFCNFFKVVTKELFLSLKTSFIDKYMVC